MISLESRVSSLTALSVGHVTHDRYGEAIVPGGCAFFGALAAAVLGAKVQLLTAVGHDFMCDAQLSRMQVHKITGGDTTVFTNSYPPGGLRIQHVETQAPKIRLEELPAEFCTPDLLFLAPVMGEIDPLEPWQKHVRAKFTSLSLQGFLKKGEDGIEGRRVVVKDNTSLPDTLFDGVNALFFSEEDLSLFGYEGMLHKLTSLVPHVFVTDGEKGCTVHSGSNKEHAGIYLTNTVDPTGAGDTFAMTTSIGLTLGLPPVQAALFGAAAASVAVEDKGSLSLERLGETFARYEQLQN